MPPSLVALHSGTARCPWWEECRPSWGHSSPLLRCDTTNGWGTRTPPLVGESLPRFLSVSHSSRAHRWRGSRGIDPSLRMKAFLRVLDDLFFPLLLPFRVCVVCGACMSTCAPLQAEKSSPLATSLPGAATIVPIVEYSRTTPERDHAPHPLLRVHPWNTKRRHENPRPPPPPPPPPPPWELAQRARER